MTGQELTALLKRELTPEVYRALAKAIQDKAAAAEQTGYERARRERSGAILTADTLRGLARSWTAWVAGLLIALPELLPTLQSDLPGLLGEQAANRVMQIAGLLMLLLRLKTTTSVTAKGAPK